MLDETGDKFGAFYKWGEVAESASSADIAGALENCLFIYFIYFFLKKRIFI